MRLWFGPAGDAGELYVDATFRSRTVSELESVLDLTSKI